MEPMQHQMMGYDRAITMFSPDGRLLQVEYAKKTVKQGSTAMGMRCKDGIVLITDKRIMDKFIVPDSIEKISEIDKHILVTASGILSDARILIERAQVRAQQNRITYDSPIDVISVVKDIANLKQLTTQSGGLRPFGVSLIIAGIDETGKKLYITDPTGIFFEYNAVVIGEGENEVTKTLESEYKESMNVDACLKLGVKALINFIGDEDSYEKRIDCAYLKVGEKNFTKLSIDDIKNIVNEVKK